MKKQYQVTRNIARDCEEIANKLHSLASKITQLGNYESDYHDYSIPLRARIKRDSLNVKKDLTEFINDLYKQTYNFFTEVTK